MLLGSSRSIVTLFALALASASPRAEVTLDALLPAEGSVGTSLDLQLTGDLGKGKPKVWLTRADSDTPKPKKTRLAVASVTDLGGGQFALDVSFAKTKTGAGVYDLHVKPKGGGLLEQVFEDVFTMRAPELASVTPDEAVAKASVTVAGEFLGEKGKPKVLLVPAAGGKAKKAKVKQVVGGTSLLLGLPKLGVGVYDVVVSTSIGADTLEDALTISAVVAPGGGDFLTATLANAVTPMLASQLVVPSGFGSTLQAFNVSAPGVPTSIITGSMTVGAQKFGISISIPFDPASTPTPFTVQLLDDPPTFAVTAEQKLVSSGEGPSWHAGFGDLTASTLSVTAADAQRMTGSFAFTLVPSDDSPDAGTLVIADGAFDVSVP